MTAASRGRPAASWTGASPVVEGGEPPVDGRRRPGATTLEGTTRAAGAALFTGGSSVRDRLRTSAPLVALVALLALLLMPHQAGAHPAPGADAAGHPVPAAAGLADMAGMAGEAVGAPLARAAAEVSAAVAGVLPGDAPGSDAVLLALGCAVLVLALVLLVRPGLHRSRSRTPAGAAARPGPAHLARGPGPPRDLLVELCVSRT